MPNNDYNFNKKAYAGYNIDENIRISSSSGGVFTLLAEEILKNGGVVFGAEFDENYNVKHGYVEKKEDLEKLRESKYVRSELGNSYVEVKKFLDSGRMVLFTGTPCQIAGLKKYLKEDYENLFLQDIICHGTPMKKVWNRYKQCMEINEKTGNVKFRSKDYGWKNYSLKIYYDNKKNYINNITKDSYMKAFLSNISLHDSCYDCKFKGETRLSDITLADFWGIEKVLPEMDDDKGTSLIIVNSDKGMQLLQNVSSNLKLEEVNFEESIKYNPSYSQSSKCHPKRKEFLEQLDTTDFDKLVNRFVHKPNITKRGLGKCIRILKSFMKLK